MTKYGKPQKVDHLQLKTIPCVLHSDMHDSKAACSIIANRSESGGISPLEVDCWRGSAQ
jgi:hypothetical protein